MFCIYNVKTFKLNKYLSVMMLNIIGGGPQENVEIYSGNERMLQWNDVTHQLSKTYVDVVMRFLEIELSSINTL